jgi:hypothetical protein
LHALIQPPAFSSTAVTGSSSSSILQQHHHHSAIPCERLIVITCFIVAICSFTGSLKCDADREALQLLDPCRQQRCKRSQPERL